MSSSALAKKLCPSQVCLSVSLHSTLLAPAGASVPKGEAMDIGLPFVRCNFEDQKWMGCCTIFWTQVISAPIRRDRPGGLWTHHEQYADQKRAPSINTGSQSRVVNTWKPTENLKNTMQVIKIVHKIAAWRTRVAVSQKEDHMLPRVPGQHAWVAMTDKNCEDAGTG